MTVKNTRNFLLACLVIGAAPAFAETTPVVVAPVVVAPVVVTPGGEVIAIVPEGATTPVNVGLVGIVVWSTTNKNPAWVDIRGMSLYNYDQDSGGQSNCDGDCAATWVPLAAEANVEGVDEWTVVTRKDGSKQWAFRTHPLYTYVRDMAPGETNGDGIAGFHLAD